MIVPVDLHKDIYEKLAQEAEAKGLTCHELIRVTFPSPKGRGFQLPEGVD